MLIDFAKVDAPLAATLEESKGNELLNVFIRTHDPISEAEQQQLSEVGVECVSRGTKVITATLSADAVRKLTQEPWVSAINLAQRLRPVDASSKSL
jgi:hypothetical protein